MAPNRGQQDQVWGPKPEGILNEGAKWGLGGQNTPLNDFGSPSKNPGSAPAQLNIYHRQQPSSLTQNTKCTVSALINAHIFFFA